MSNISPCYIYSVYIMGSRQRQSVCMAAFLQKNRPVLFQYKKNREIPTLQHAETITALSFISCVETVLKTHTEELVL